MVEELELHAGETLDSAVNKLLKAKEEGRQVFCNFNGVKLYSDNVTIDLAYYEKCGYTKAEYDEKLKKYIEETKKKMEEDKKLAIENIPNQIEKGKALIYPFRHNDWAKFVDMEANGVYHGLITKDSLEIMKAIEEEKPIEELVEMFDKQEHSGWSASLTRNVIITYSKNGYPFYNATHYGKWTIEECEAIKKILQENEDNIKDLCFANSVLESKNDIIAKQKKINKRQL